MQFFLSPLFLYFFILEFRNLFLSVPTVYSCVLFCSLSCPSYIFLLFFLFIVLFSPLCLFTLFSNLPYCFLFISAILSFLFSYYSILSASPLCSITNKSVLFCYSSSFQNTLTSTSLLSVLLLLHFFLYSFLFDKDPVTLPFLCSFHSFSLFFPSFLFLFFFMLPSCSCFCSFTFSVPF